MSGSRGTPHQPRLTRPSSKLPKNSWSLGPFERSVGHLQKRGNAAFRARRKAKCEAKKLTQEQGRKADAEAEQSAGGQSIFPKV
jgi:hypothetical protein